MISQTIRDDQDEENEAHREEGTNKDEVAPVAPVMQVDDEENEAHGEEGTNEDEVAPVAPVMQVDEVMDERYGRRLGKYNFRARKPRDYSHLHALLESIVMTQHSFRKGLRIFGEAGIDAVLKELTQLYDHEVIKAKRQRRDDCRRARGGTAISHVSEAETRWCSERKRLCRRQETTTLYNQGGSKLTNSCN